MLLRSPAPGSIARRRVVVVVARLLVAVAVAALTALSVLAMGDDRRVAPHLVADGTATSSWRSSSLSSSTVRLGVAAAVERTLAAGSARIEATYQPAHGPPVRITGRTSLGGPASEITAAVGDDPPAIVRVTSDGRAWLRPPGAPDWRPVSPDQIAGATAARGWGDVLRRLDDSNTVQTDDAGRITRLRLAPDRHGATLDVRLSDFGTDVAVVPP